MGQMSKAIKMVSTIGMTAAAMVFASGCADTPGPPPPPCVRASTAASAASAPTPTSAATLFEGRQTKAVNVDVDELYKKIGKLEMERDFLASRPGVSGHLS